jgi:hypothetical protein
MQHMPVADGEPAAAIGFDLGIGRPALAHSSWNSKVFAGPPSHDIRGKVKVSRGQGRNSGHRTVPSKS